MNPSTAAARALVRALVGAAVTDVVLCPGSRSAPLAYALAAADAAGVLRLHVRIDERAAAFTALGLGIGAAGPAAVVTTSGTAVANLHPAVLEAHEAGVPLLVLTADRPHGLRGTWANQTTALQAGLFGAAPRFAADLPAPADGDDPGRWADAVRAAVAASRGCPLGARPGPAHLDVAFDDPLVPDDDPPPAWDPPVAVDAPSSPAQSWQTLEQGPRTVVVAGAGAGDEARELAERAGWPLLAEPSSGARWGPNAVGPYRLLLDVEALGGRVERVVVLGRPTLSRPVTRLLGRPDVDVVQVVRHPDDPGPARTTRRVVGGVTAAEHGDGEWLDAWRTAGAAAAAAVDDVLGDRLVGPLVAREVAAATAADDVLVAAASNAVRDLDLAARPWPAARRVVANRGLSGIDGTLSTASGVALASRAVVRALVGDLAFLHDVGGLVLGPGEPEPSLQVVVLNDDGGAIFGLLEHGEPRFASVVERVFATPHGADLAALSRGLGVDYRAVRDLEELRAALAAPPPGRSVVEVRADRSGLRALHDRIRRAATVAAGAGPT
ncbi:MAG: 2-succinyl-5-enolpyruvyl-6-hydroxy-3-cyclohexene-1-carboxylic-acid synthase [Actinomycetes bacterium]